MTRESIFDQQSKRAREEALVRRKKDKDKALPKEIKGRCGLEPTRYGDWEVKDARDAKRGVVRPPLEELLRVPAHHVAAVPLETQDALLDHAEIIAVVVLPWHHLVQGQVAQEARAREASPRDAGEVLDVLADAGLGEPPQQTAVEGGGPDPATRECDREAIVTYHHTAKGSRTTRRR